jgi:hypothetical protein
MEEDILKILKDSYSEYTSTDQDGNVIGGELKFEPEIAAKEIYKYWLTVKK